MNRAQERERVHAEVFDWADDVLAEHNLFQMLADSLPARPGEKDCLWYDGGDDILCRTEDHANAVADWLDGHGYEAVTGYFDPAEDDRDNCRDDLTGWYYVTV